MEDVQKRSCAACQFALVFLGNGLCVCSLDNFHHAIENFCKNWKSSSKDDFDEKGKEKGNGE